MILKLGKKGKDAYQVNLNTGVSIVDVKEYCKRFGSLKLSAKEVGFAMEHGLRESLARGVLEEVKPIAVAAKVEAPKVEPAKGEIKSEPVKVEEIKIEEPPKVEEPPKSKRNKKAE